METPHLFITGMGGMEGRQLAPIAVGQGYKVSGTVHGEIPPELVTLEKQGKLESYKLDLMNDRQIRFLLTEIKPDVIIHLAGHGIDNPKLGFGVFSDNVMMLHFLVDGMLRLKEKPRLVLASSIVVNGRQEADTPVLEESWMRIPNLQVMKHPYKGSKLSQEQYLDEIAVKRDPFFNYVIARPGQHTGPGRKPGVVEYDIATEIMRIKNGGEGVIKVRNKLAEVDMLDARDVAMAYLLMIGNAYPGDICNVVSGRPSTIESVAKTMLDVAAFSPEEISRIPIISTGIEQSSFARFSNRKLQSYGWEQQFSLREALQSFWQDFELRQHIDSNTVVHRSFVNRVRQLLPIF